MSSQRTRARKQLNVNQWNRALDMPSERWKTSHFSPDEIRPCPLSIESDVFSAVFSFINSVSTGFNFYLCLETFFLDI